METRWSPKYDPSLDMNVRVHIAITVETIAILAGGRATGNGIAVPLETICSAPWETKSSFAAFLLSMWSLRIHEGGLILDVGE